MNHIQMLYLTRRNLYLPKGTKNNLSQVGYTHQVYTQHQNSGGLQKPEKRQLILENSMLLALFDR